MAYCNASTLRMNWQVGSGGIRIGSEVTIFLSVRSACLHFSDQSNGMSFFRRLVSGLAMCAKLRMKCYAWFCSGLIAQIPILGL